MGAQDLLDSFYDIDNLITVSVTIKEEYWEAILDAEPRGGFGFKEKRFDWYNATSVSISGAKFPQEFTFGNVGIVKKSFWGSFSKTKPSLKLDFGQYDDNEDAIEDLIGTHRITLNNSIQDPSYIRQPFGYQLFREAGVPGFRCNFAQVIVNGTNMGVYVNLEPMQKRFVENVFDKNKDGNAYEVEWVPGLENELAYIKQGYISFEGFSDHDDEKDLNLAAKTISDSGLTGVKQVVDMEDFIKFYAMESLLKHWDGYTHGLNNTFIYNDVKAVAEPTVDNVRLKFVPSGIDQILQRDRPFEFGSTSILAKLVLNDDTARQNLYAQIRKFATDVFSGDKYENLLEPLMARLVAVLNSAGVEGKDFEGQIDIVKDQLQRIRAARFTIQGVDVVLDLAAQHF